MKVLIIGRNEILYATALYLNRFHQVCAIITAPAAPEYEKKEKDFKQLSRKFKIPFLLKKSIDKDVTELVEKTKPDIAISINWISIINLDFIEKFRFGILNCHPSKLPQFRGNAATNWAIVLGEKKVGFTVHFMKEGELDSGDILVQKTFSINDETTIKDLNTLWLNKSPLMFKEALTLIKKKSIPRKQKSVGFRAYPRLPADSKIDWSKSAREIHNIIRASTKPYSGAFTYLKLNDQIKKVFIWKSRIVTENTKDISIPGHIIFNDRKTGESHIYTGRGIIAVSELQFKDESIFQPGVFFKSIRMQFGFDVEEEIMKLINVR